MWKCFGCGSPTDTMGSLCELCSGRHQKAPRLTQNNTVVYENDRPFIGILPDNTENIYPVGKPTPILTSVEVFSNYAWRFTILASLWLGMSGLAMTMFFFAWVFFKALTRTP